MHKQNDIEAVIENYTTSLNPTDRYTSFDYCYNYFQLTKDLTKDIEKSCLVLGFYLASWGMYRGSSFLLQHSVKHLQSAIEYFSSLDKNEPIWNIDVDSYTEENIHIIIEVYQEIKRRLIPQGKSDLTLVTKVMLGVFGAIPAFDNNFCKTFRELFDGQCGFRRVNMHSLNLIHTFYQENKNIIDSLSENTFTTDFITGKKTQIKYPKVKIIDMYGFIKIAI